MAKRKASIKVEWTDKAKYQLYDILEYWTNRNKSKKYPTKILNELDDKLKFIKQNPLASASTNYPNTRKCAMGYFSIVYKIETDRIFITSFWDNRQNPTKLDEIIKG
jgi:plasmid stabilization system protein ParE